MNLHAFFICMSTAYVYAQISNNPLGMIDKIYNKCHKKDSVIKCLKVQALKIAGRALHAPSLAITDGIRIVRYGNESSDGTLNRVNLGEEKLEKLDSAVIDELLLNTTTNFLSTHSVQLNLPELVEEGRGKRKRQRYPGLLMGGLAIKGFFLAMAYKGIAVMSGTAILIGKMALLLSALLGLKKLVSHEPEKTTFEIVKHPVHSESHSHSVSHDEEDLGHYYRALGSSHEDMAMQDKAYRGHIPPY